MDKIFAKEPIDNSRLRVIDVARCLGMLMVIHNHLGLDYSNNIIKILFASFHMPLFFFLSGLVRSADINSRSFKEYLFKRITTILIPYYLWSFIFIDFNAVSFLYVLFGSNKAITLAGGVGGSWFLPCFFVSDLLFFAIKRITKNRVMLESVIAVISFVLGWVSSKLQSPIGLFMSIDVALCGLGFILIGNILKKYEFLSKITHARVVHNLILFIVLFACTFGIAIANTSSYDNEYMRPVMALGYYGNIMLFVITGVMGSLSILFISVVVEKTKISKMLESIGRNTFCILLVQQLCINYSERILVKFSFLFNPIGAFVISIGILIIANFISIIVTYIVPNLGGKYLLRK